MNILVRFVHRYWIYFVPILLLLIFVGSMLDRNYYFGGDLLFPINPQDSIIKSIYLWVEQNGGNSFFQYVLLLWQGFFYVLSLVQIPIDIVIKIFIITIYLLGFIFSYLLYITLFKETKWGTKKFALLFALFFLLNPAAILVVVGTLELYAVPICAYFLIKYLDTKNILYIIPFSFFVNISFFPGLPQAKPLIVFIIATFFILIIYSLLRNVKIKSLISPLILLTIITFLLNAFVLIPFINDAFGDKGFYQEYTKAVITYNGDADLYSAAIPYTTRFYNSNLVDKNSPLGHFLANPLFISWTFFLLFIGLLSIFFTQEKRDKQLVYICLFAFLILIFIAKGANPPFGEIYRWSLSHIPIAKLFRTTSTSIIGAVIFYTLMVTISMYFMSKRWKVVLPIIAIANIIMLHGIYLGFKLENANLIRQKGITIPNEYFKMGNILNNLKKEGKVLVLPLSDGYVTKKWSYTGQPLIPWLTKRPIISSDLNTTDNLDQRTFNELCSFTSLYNIRYLLQEKDTLGKEIKKDIDYQGKTLMDNNYFKLQEVKESCYLPHFYTSENTIYFNGSMQHIPNLSYLPIYNKNSIIFTPDNTVKNKQNEEELKNRVKNLVTEVLPNNVDTNFDKKIYIYSVFGEDKLIGNIIYPYVRISPNSIFYPFILWKEEYFLKKIQPHTRQRMDRELFYASKKIYETSIWGSISSNKTQIRFKSYMERAIQTAATTEERRYNLELAYEYLQGFRQKIKETIKTSSFWNKEKINSWTKLFDNLERQIKELHKFSDYDNLSYFVLSPGQYHGYILLDKGRSLIDGSVKMSVLLNNDQIATYSAKEIENKVVIDLDNLNISSPKNTMTVQITNRENLIDSSKWNTVEQMQAVTIDSGGILFSPNLKVASGGVYSNPVIYQEIKHWISGATYLLKIRHKEQDGANLHLRLREKRNIYDNNTDSWHIGEINIFNDDINSKPKGDELKVIVTADKNATGALLYISGVNGITKIESIELERILIPNIYLINEKNDQKTIVNQKPTVNFTKINPTKYKVTISNMTNPFFLVFSETFDKGWKIYGKDTAYLPETQHFLVNGYANAWYLTPKDLDGKNQSKFIVEYVPQRLFYLGQIISVVAFFFCIVYSLYRYIKNKA